MNNKNINILVTSAGRRVALVKYFKDAIKKIDHINGRVISVDASPLAAALFVSDDYYIVPKNSEDNFVDALLNVCLKEKINIVIPTIDTELFILAKNKERFRAQEIVISISDEEVINICRSKYNTFKFFKKNNIPTVNTFLPNQLKNKRRINFPLFLKPNKGSSSIGSYKINNKKELDFFIDYIDDPIIQEFADGQEYTLDILSDFYRKVINIIPRKRIETRAGEINKGITVFDKKIISHAKKVAEKLMSIGPITVQCFLKSDNIKFTEINPRFGGGYPLSHEAGANYPELLIRMALGENIETQIGNFKNNLVMLRWEDAVFLPKELVQFKKDY
jgi:carbamoyl-phosphate synthase large subunit